MILWRISAYAELEGIGGLRVSGRWHSRGRPIVYCADSSALAMLEVLVHLEVANMPPDFQLLKITAPDDAPSRSWSRPPTVDERATARWGDAWLRGGGTVLARVPSIIAPGSFNWLINPLHADAEAIEVVARSRHPWDRRLFR